MPTCKTCKHWKEYKRTCERVDLDTTLDTQFGIVVYVSDDHGLEVSLITGPNFGCIHHETRATNG